MTHDPDERDVDKITKRAQKEAAKLRGQPDLTTKAWKAYEHLAACAARLARGASPAQATAVTARGKPGDGWW